MQTQKLREELKELGSLVEKLGHEEDRSGTDFTLRDRTQEVSIEKYGIPFKPSSHTGKQITFLDPSGEGYSNPNSFGCNYDGAWCEFPDHLGLMGMPGAQYYGKRYRNDEIIGFLIIGKVESEDECVRQFDKHSDLINAARAYVLKGDDFHTVLKAKHAHFRLDASSSASSGTPVELNERVAYMARILSLAEDNPNINVANQCLVDEYIKQFSFHEEEKQVKRRLDALGDDFRNHVGTRRLEFGNGAVEIDSYRDAVFGYYKYRKAQVDAIDLMTINNYRIERVKEEVERIGQIKKVLPRHSLGLLQNLV
ncbi:MAG TPA: hypothetical protein VJH37_02305 [Candidatus Nanoarchaeia archaeon]|nr:hypothetical protein [Candidatus Nanoarchaeia archaeon]